MNQHKEDPLNGAPQQYYRRDRQCNPLRTLFMVIISLCFILGITAFILGLVLRPTTIKVHVERASLTQLNLSDNRILQYNLSLDLSVRNPNRRIGIYYDRLEARALYGGERFGYTALPTFYQGHNNTSMINPTFSGQNFINLRGSDFFGFNSETANGVFHVDVKIYARIRFKVGSLKTRRYKPNFDCELRIPLAANATTVGSFTRTKCDVDF